MDTPPIAHPPEDLLRAFGLGQLEAPEAEEVAAHLDRCPDCSETIAGLEDDTFVSLVRNSPGPLAHSRPASPVTIDSTTGGADAAIQAELPAVLRQHPRYQIVGRIGRGGMGDVYKAQHKIMNRTVALKVIRPELVSNAAAVNRFQREVQAAARLHHGNIVTAYDAEQAGNLHFLVMEFVDGVDLSQVVQQRGALAICEACDYIRQAATGLEHAHQLGMVHRDIKPHNLMLTGSSEIKILDFGLANFVSEIAADDVSDDESTDRRGTPCSIQQLTQMGTMMGTPDYIAPEQAADARRTDIRSDIYSLGCTLSYLLTGQPVFEEASVNEKLKAHAEQPPPRLSETRRDIPPELQQVVDQMLAKDPAQRFQTPAEVASALQYVVSNFRQAKAKEQEGQTGSPSPHRHRPRVLVAAALLLPLLLLTGVIIYLATDTGLVEIDSTGFHDPSAKVVLLKDGTEYTSFDVIGSQQFQRIRAGEYEIQLRGAPASVKMSVWSKSGRTNKWGEPDNHEKRPVVLARGGGLLVRILRREVAAVPGS